ncbi:MAG: NAD(P)-dependent alcohol dehydrogenase [Gammaproteobacteria bacterium]|nr:NAD(P)-dependent alcohol dehydrogenase [Gammaproteobacteria bacterium]
MKALESTKYGWPDGLSITAREKPAPSEDEVLIKVYTAAVNDYDWSMVIGRPFIYRLMFGLRKPRHPVAGMEVAGIIESVGSNVEEFKTGDAVYGDTSDHGFGSFAEYFCVHKNAVQLKPELMSFEHAAALPHASALAMQGLFGHGKLKQNENILINGAGGGVGTLALQLAKLNNATVTGVDTGDKLKSMSDLGFDHVIDYKTTDFTRQKKHYDLILDAKTSRSIFDYQRALTKDGRYVTVGGHLPRLLQILLLKPLLHFLVRKRFSIVALKPNKDMDYLSDLHKQGKLIPLIDGPHPFEKLPELLDYFGRGKHTGKVIISVYPNKPK